MTLCFLLYFPRLFLFVEDERERVFVSILQLEENLCLDCMFQVKCHLYFYCFKILNTLLIFKREECNLCSSIVFQIVCFNTWDTDRVRLHYLAFYKKTEGVYWNQAKSCIIFNFFNLSPLKQLFNINYGKGFLSKKFNFWLIKT